MTAVIAILISVHSLVRPFLRGSTDAAGQPLLVTRVTPRQNAPTQGHNQPSTRSARSIWAVAASTSLRFPVSAARRSNSAAKSQCGRAWRHVLSRPTKHAASQLDARPAGRLNPARERELEIRCVRHARIVADTRRRFEAPTYLFPRGLAPPPRLTLLRVRN
jgi:hypothetical protein